MYEGPRQLKVIEMPRLPLKENQIRLKTICSGVSHGTEMNVYRGLAPFFQKKTGPGNAPVFGGRTGRNMGVPDQKL